MVEMVELENEEQRSLLLTDNNGDRSWRLNFESFQLSSPHAEKQVKPPHRIPDYYGVLDCDLYHGSWIYDSSGPLYTNNSCPQLTHMQNCQGNGRPDKDYENWRWKPSQCDLPRNFWS